jgi:hypothetical protein
MNFRTPNIRPSLAQLAPFLSSCILFLSPALLWADTNWPDGMLHVVLIDELPESGILS